MTDRDTGASVLYNLHIYNSPFTHETRILKITVWVVRARVCDRVEIVGILEPGLAPSERIDAHRTVTRLAAERLAYFGTAGRFVEWYVRILARYGRRRIALINAHSLAVLPVCVLLKWLTGARLIYDTHELETETSATTAFRRRFGRAVERSGLKFVDAVSVVGENIRDWYEREYDLRRVHVVKNYPPKRQGMPEGNLLLRSAFEIPDDALVYIYHGLITEVRGSRLIIEAFARAPSHCHVVFMGFGADVSVVMDAARRFANIHFHPAVTPVDVPRFVAGADVGICVLKNTCLNHYFIAPNKVFDYLNAGLAVIGSDFPELSNEINSIAGGWLIPPTSEALLALVATLNRHDIDEKKNGAKQWSVRSGWETQFPHLAALYADAGFTPRSAA